MTTPEIQQILDDYHTNTLRQIGDYTKLPIKVGSKKVSKARLHEVLATQLFTAERVQADFSMLTELEAAVFNRLLLHDGKTATSQFKRELARAKLTTPTPPALERNYYDPEHPYREKEYIAKVDSKKSAIFEDVMARLMLYGLVFSQETKQKTAKKYFRIQLQPGLILYVPEAVRRHLPEPTPLVQTDETWQPEHIEPTDPALFLRDLYLYWDYVRQNEVKLIKQGFVAKRHLKGVNALLLLPDKSLDEARREDETRRLMLLREVLTKLGLVQVNGSALQITASDAIFWRQSTAEQLLACFQVWQGLSLFQELAEEADEYAPNYGAARRGVVVGLGKMPAKTWLEVDDLYHHLQDNNPQFLFPLRHKVENHYSNYVYVDTIHGHKVDILAGFARMESRFVQTCLQLLADWGVVVLGSRSEGEQTRELFFITKQGKGFLAGKALKGEAENAGNVVLQPNFQILAMGPVPLNVLAILDFFCERQSVDRGAFQYLLTRESVYTAQQAGMATEEMMRFLVAQTGSELSQNVRRSLEEWGASHERIVFRVGVNILQAATPDLLAKLQADAKVGKGLGRAASPTVALVKSRGTKGMTKGLQGMGLLPAISGADPSETDHSVSIAADGVIVPIHAVPSLHLRGRLVKLAEEKANGAWQLTEQSVKKAGGSKGKVQSLLGELEKLQRGKMPASLPDQVKAWGNYYGKVGVATVTLLTVADEGLLAELCRHPKLKSYLTPFPADRPMATVPTDKVALVQAVLRRLGAVVGDVVIENAGK